MHKAFRPRICCPHSRWRECVMAFVEIETVQSRNELFNAGDLSSWHENRFQSSLCVWVGGVGGEGMVQSISSAALDSDYLFSM